jgi:hypothetical protein
VGTSTIRRVLQAAGSSYQRTRTWCPTGTAQRTRKAGVVTVVDPKTEQKRNLIDQAYRIAETMGIPLWCQDEAGPYQAIPQSGQSWQPEGKPRRQPHEYIRGGTAKLLTLFRPATGEVRAKAASRSPNLVLHPGQRIFVDDAVFHDHLQVVGWVSKKVDVLQRIAFDKQQVRERGFLDDTEFPRIGVALT